MHGAQRESINRKLDVARAVVLMLQDPLERWFTHGVVLYYRWLMLKYCFFSPVMYAHFCCSLAVHGDTVAVTVLRLLLFVDSMCIVTHHEVALRQGVEIEFLAGINYDTHLFSSLQ